VNNNAQKAETLAEALHLETGNYTTLPPAEVMKRDIKVLEARLKQFPSDDYAEIAGEMIEQLKQALQDYHKIEYTP